MALAGCRAVGPDYLEPEVTLPGAFTAQLELGLGGESPALAEWWTTLEDKTLDSLIERTLRGNLTLRSALARITEARALRGVVDSDKVPTISASGSYQTTQQSTETPLGAFGPRRSDLNALGLDVYWELDLWGRVQRSVEAAEADIQVEVEEARFVVVSLLAETALAYVDLRESQRQLEIARGNLELQGQTVELTENQFRANLVSQLDVSQAKSLYAGTQASMPLLAAAARAARNRLAVLAGVNPGALEAELSAPGSSPFLGEVDSVPVGMPAELLRRRPDIRAAERRLAAQTARVGVATADLYPRFSLLGSFGLQASDAGDLFEESAQTYSLGPAFDWSVFDRRRVRGALEVSNARLDRALASYEETVLRALEEVENAMSALVENQRRAAALGNAVTESRRAVELSQDQYRQGIVSFQSVLDTQRRLFDFEASLVQTRASITIQLILLYKALGGGWEARDIILQQHQSPADSEGKSTQS